MTEKEKLSICQLRQGQSGRVIEIVGGHGIAERLNAMGIRPDKNITKVSSSFMRGPITVSVDRCQIAVGYGMAQKVLVEVI